MSAHDIQQVQSAHQIVGVVLQGLGNAFAHCLQTGKVDHGVDIRILGEHGLGGSQIAQLSLDKGDLLAGDLLYPAEGFLTGIGQVIHDHDVVAGLDQFNTSMAADITGAAANQNGHSKNSL